MKSNSIKKIFTYLKKKNAKRFSIFFMIAFVFLIFSKLSNDYKQIIKLNPILTNLDSEILLQHDSLNDIDVYVQAKGFALLPYFFKTSKTITLDVKADVITKSNHYVFDVQKNKFLIEDQLGKSYKVLSIKPDTLFLSYSKLASKIVPVILKKNVSYATGFDVAERFILNSDSVKLVGSEVEIDTIKSITTELLELTGVKKNISETVQLNVDTYNSIEIFPKSVTVNAKVVRFTEGTVEVPVKIVNKPSKVIINYFPKTVSLSYYVDLEHYNSIEPSNFMVECDYRQLETGQTYFLPKIALQPEFVKRVNIKQKRIDFIKL